MINLNELYKEITQNRPNNGFPLLHIYTKEKEIRTRFKNLK